MTIVALGIALLALVVSIIALAALLELYAGYSQLQSLLGGSGAEVVLLEEVTKTIIARDPREVGLPVPREKAVWYVLFVSPHCATCRRIVMGLAGNLPLSLSIVVSGTDTGEARRWLSSLGVEDLEALLDPVPDLLDQIGLNITPTVMVIIGDEMAFVAAVDSVDALNRVVVQKYVPPEALALRAGVPNP